MAIGKIPTLPSVPFYTQRTSLDGQLYLLEFKWNELNESWYLSLYTDLGEPLQYNMRLSADFPINYLTTDPRAPQGWIIAYDTTKQGVDPAFDDLGTRSLLLYFDEEEVNGL